MAVNKVVYNTENGEQVLIDLTGDTVTPETLAEGVIAHDASGNIIIGTAKLAPKDTNLVPTSIIPDTEATPSGATKGVGYYDEARLNSSGLVVYQANSTATGFIEVKKGDKFELTGVRFGTSTMTGVYGYVAIYNASKAKLQSVSMDTYITSPSSFGFAISPLKTSGTVLPTDVITIDFANAPSDMAYVRFSSSIGGIVDPYIPKQSGKDMIVRKV